MNLFELGIPEPYTFKLIVSNLKAIKCNYTSILLSFFPFELHAKVICLKQIHDLFYSLSLEEWQIDRIWEFLNNDIGFEVFENILNRQKSKTML